MSAISTREKAAEVADSFERSSCSSSCIHVYMYISIFFILRIDRCTY
jgi:hypothetical protein